MTGHEQSAEQLAEAAGGHIAAANSMENTAQQAEIDAQIATAEATLAVAQRLGELAAIGERIADAFESA